MNGANELIDGLKKEIAAEESRKTSMQAEFTNIVRQKVAEQFVKTVLDGIKESLRKEAYTEVGGKKRIEFFVGCDRLSYPNGIQTRTLLPEEKCGKKVFKLPDIIISGKLILAPFGRVRMESKRTQNTNFWGKPKPGSYTFVGVQCSLDEETILIFGKAKAALKQKGISCSLGMLDCRTYYDGPENFVEETSYLFRTSNVCEGFPAIKVWCDFD